MGALVEVSHDNKGIVWYPQVSPFDVHLIELPGGKKAKEIYERLSDGGIEVLWDDREASAGEKFVDSDLIGIPVRLVVSDKTKDKIEWKRRNSDETGLLSFDELASKFSLTVK